MAIPSPPADVPTPSSAAAPARWEVAALLAQAIALITLAWWRLASSPLLFRDQEELHSASAALDLWLLGRWSDVFRLQYFPFCGGCTVESIAAVPLFAAFGPSLATWKLIPIGISVLGLVSWWALGRWVAGPRGGLAAAAVWLIGSPVFFDLRLYAWGNHVEVITLAPVALLLAATVQDAGGAVRVPRAAALGATLGFALWISPAAIYVIASALLVAVVRAPRRPPARAVLALALGGVVGGSPWILHHVVLHPFETGWLLFDDELGGVLSRFDLALLPRKLGEIALPDALAHVTFGRAPPDLANGRWPAAGLVRFGALAAGLLSGVTLLRSGGRRARWLVVLLPTVVFAVIYCLAGEEFSVTLGDGSDVYQPVRMRYLAPALVLLPMSAMLAAVQRGPRAATIVAVLLLAPSVAVLGARLGASEGQLTLLSGYHLPWFEANRGLQTPGLDPETLAACEGPLCTSLARRAGRRVAGEVQEGQIPAHTIASTFARLDQLTRAFAEGLASGLVRHWVSEDPTLAPQSPTFLAAARSFSALVPESARGAFDAQVARELRHAVWAAIAMEPAGEAVERAGALLDAVAQSSEDGPAMAQQLAHSVGHALVAQQIDASWLDPNGFAPALTPSGGRHLSVEAVFVQIVALPAPWIDAAARGAGAAVAEVLGCSQDLGERWSAHAPQAHQAAFLAGAEDERGWMCRREDRDGL